MASYFTKNRKKTLALIFSPRQIFLILIFISLGIEDPQYICICQKTEVRGKFSSATIQVRDTVEILWLGGKCPNWLHNPNNQYLGLSIFHCALTLLKIVFHQPFNFNFDLGSLSMWLSPPEMFSGILCDKSHHSNLDSTCYLWLSSGHHT